MSLRSASFSTTSDEEEMIVEEQTEDLPSKPQKEILYNKILPYADKLEEESQRLFLEIKTNLIKSVLAREIRPGCSLWTTRLNKYMKIYGLKFSKHDHIALIKIYYELLILPNLEPVRVNNFASTLTQLLKKRYLLSRDELQLDWKPLFTMCIRVLEKSRCDIGMYRFFNTIESTICNAIRYCRVYFPASATKEILAEFRPKLCPFNNSEIETAIHYLELLLPLHMKPNEFDQSCHLWFEELMDFWNTCSNITYFENSMMWLMARFASASMGYISWEPYVPIMFDRFLRVLQLPVAFKQRRSLKKFKMDTSSIAVWIISTLHGDKTSTFFHFEKFMQTLQSYFYSANSGAWTDKLRELVYRLTFYFVQRLHVERFKKPTWETRVPEEYKLTEEDIDRFVNILKPCMEQAIFTRQGLQDVSLSLQYLASLRPQIIIPFILEKVFALKDSLTEPHKLTSSMTAVIAVTKYMVQGAQRNYPEGPTHVIPLLLAFLPGIDPNDTKKSFVTFNLIVHFVQMIPLINSSEAACYYNNLTEEEHTICEATAMFEDFVLQLIDQIFVWVESNSLDFVRLEQNTNNSSTKTVVESMSENALATLLLVVLNQCSPEIFTAALKKVFKFTTEKILEIQISGKLVAIMCRTFVEVNPRESLKLFLPHFCDNVETILNENPNIAKEEHLDAEFLYNFQILSELCNGRSELLPYMDRLCNILDKTLHMNSPLGNQLSARMLEFILYSLTNLIHYENRSSCKDYGSPLSEFLSVRDWGKQYRIEDIKVSWYVPGEKEIHCVRSLVNKYLVPEIETLKKYAAGDVTLSRENLKTSLRIIISVLHAQSVFPLWKEPALKLIDSVIDAWSFDITIGCDLTVEMPDGSNVRKVIADTLHLVQKRLLEVDEGDTKSIGFLITVYKILVFNRVKSYCEYDLQWKSFASLKKLSEDRLQPMKTHLRKLLIDRAYLQQVLRMESRSYSFTETHKQIMLDLFQFCVSNYSENRIKAQTQICSMVSFFAYSYSVLTPHIKEILQLNTEENHEKFKGCLYVLLGPKSSPIVTRHDWSFISQVWVLLINSMPSEKISIVNLMRHVSDVIHKYFPTIGIVSVVPQSCLEAVKFFGKDLKTSIKDFEEIEQKSLENLENANKLRKKIYQEAVDNILDSCITKNLHWRHHVMALRMSRDLVHLDVHYSAKNLKYFLQCLIDESLIVRKIAIKVCLYSVIQNKPRFKKITVDPYSISGGDKNEKMKSGIRVDNQWLLYNYETAPKCSEDWEKPRYIHDSVFGYYCWPEKVEVYAPSTEHSTANKRLDNLSDCEKEIYNFFSNKDNVDQFIKYLSLEEKKGKDQFNPYRFVLFKNLSKMFEDQFLDILLPHFERLCADKHEASQRCAAEIMGGLIKGTKHWSFDKVESLWKKLLPILRTASTNMLEETIHDWSFSMALMMESRDPNRYHWLIEFLLEDPLADSTSFIASIRLHLLYSALNQQLWRVPEMSRRLFTYSKSHLSHSFQNIREKMSLCLSVMFSQDQVNDRCTNKPLKMKDLFEEVMPDLNSLYEFLLNKGGENMSLTLEPNQEITSVLATLTDGEKEKKMRLLKVVFRSVTLMLGKSKVIQHVAPEFYSLIPLACVVQSDTTDDEMNGLCTNLLALVAPALTPPTAIPEALAMVSQAASCPYWSARAVLAEFLATFVFCNMATVLSNRDWVMQVQKLVLGLLEDTQPEVRVNASEVLSGLLHCNFLPSPMDLLTLFKKMAKCTINRTGMNRSATSNGIRTRHAGVLGLCAFISCHPYDVPEYLPSIFSQLGPHLNDPQPIPSTIRKTLSNFKRTHHGNWEEHKLKFTEDELSVLSDLTVPPSYYA